MARVLVADDSDRIRLLITTSLTRQGYSVAQAADGAQALELLTTEAFEAAVIDVTMPGLDGLTLCRIVRATAGLGHLVVVVVSADASEVAALAAGADAFLTKPFLPSRLCAVVGELVGGTRHGLSSLQR